MEQLWVYQRLASHRVRYQHGGYSALFPDAGMVRPSQVTANSTASPSRNRLPPLLPLKEITNNRGGSKLLRFPALKPHN